MVFFFNFYLYLRLIEAYKFHLKSDFYVPSLSHFETVIFTDAQTGLSKMLTCYEFFFSIYLVTYNAIKHNSTSIPNHVSFHL